MDETRRKAVNEFLDTEDEWIELNDAKGEKKQYFASIQNNEDEGYELGLYETDLGLRVEPEPISSGKIRLSNNQLVIEKASMRYQELWSDIFIHAEETNDLSTEELNQVDELVDEFPHDVSEFYLLSAKPYAEIANYSGLVVAGKRESLETIEQALLQSGNREIIKLLQPEDRQNGEKFHDYIKIVNHPADDSKRIIVSRLTMNSGASHEIDLVLVIDKNSKILEFIRTGKNLRLLPIILRHGGYIQNPESQKLLDQKYSHHNLVVVDAENLEFSQYLDNQRQFSFDKNSLRDESELRAAAANAYVSTRSYPTPTTIFPTNLLK